jgi:hypothetical protein
MCFYNSDKLAYLEQNEFLSFENADGRQYSRKKLTQVSQGNNVLDAPASNLDNFILRHTCVYSNQLNRPILNKVTVSPP